MAEVVDLCDTPEREHRLSIEPTAKKRRTLDGASACDPKDNVIDLCASASDADDDDGVVEVHAENARRSASAVCQMNAGPSGDDGDIEITAASGAFANADFPHARENCAIHPMTPGSESSHWCARGAAARPCALAPRGETRDPCPRLSHARVSPCAAPSSRGPRTCAPRACSALQPAVPLLRVRRAGLELP